MGGKYCRQWAAGMTDDRGHTPEGGEWRIGLSDADKEKLREADVFRRLSWAVCLLRDLVEGGETVAWMREREIPWAVAREIDCARDFLDIVAPRQK
jgi:hypothetical protein